MKIADIVQEGFVDTLKAKTQQVFAYFGKIFDKIKFGQRVEVNLGDYLTGQTMTEKAMPAGQTDIQGQLNDLKSVIGYYNEYAVAYKLAFLLEKSGVNIKENTDQALKKYADNYRKYIVKNTPNFTATTPDKVNAELERVDAGSDIMAEKLYSEITQDNDVKLIDVSIVLTGDSGKGKEKEDIKVSVYKKNTKQTIDVIKASLKIYKGTNINMANMTFASYLVNVIANMPDTGGGEKSIAAFLQQYPQYKKEMEKVSAITKKWKEIKKTQDREAANKYVAQAKGYQQMRNLLFNKIFKDFYAKDKAAINERILKQVGLDGADEVYMLIGEKREKMVAVSSRTSPEFKQLYENLKSNFNISFTNPSTANCKMIIADEQGTTLATFTLAFKEGATIPHFWDTKDIYKSAKSAKSA